MPIPIPVYNADGTRNQAGPITEMAELILAIGDHQERIQLAVTNLGNTDLFIGYEWLRFHNPNIDWERGNLTLNRCPEVCGYIHPTPRDQQPDVFQVNQISSELEEEDQVFMFDWQGYEDEKEYWQKQFNIRRLQSQEDLQNLIEPNYFKEFPEVFGKQEFDKLPEQRP